MPENLTGTLTSSNYSFQCPDLYPSSCISNHTTPYHISYHKTDHVTSPTRIDNPGSGSSPAEGLFDAVPSAVSQLDISDMPASYSPGTAADKSKPHCILGMLYGLVLLATSRRGGRLRCNPGECFPQVD